MIHPVPQITIHQSFQIPSWDVMSLYLTEEEVAQWFHDEHEREMPEGLFANEDKNKDGYISWDEFGGPKGSSPPKQEL